MFNVVIDGLTIILIYRVRSLLVFNGQRCGRTVQYVQFKTVNIWDILSLKLKLYGGNEFICTRSHLQSSDRQFKMI